MTKDDSCVLLVLLDSVDLLDTSMLSMAERTESRRDVFNMASAPKETNKCPDIEVDSKCLFHALPGLLQTVER